MGDTNTYGDAEKFNPVDYYAKSLKDRVRDAAGKFIDRLTDQAKVDTAANCETYKKLTAAQAVDKKEDGRRNRMTTLRNFCIALDIAAFICAVIGLVMICTEGDLTTSLCLLIIGAVVGVGLLVLILTYFKKKLREMAADDAKRNAEIKALDMECLKQLSHLKDLLRWDDFNNVSNSVCTMFTLDPSFSMNKYAKLSKTYGFVDIVGEDQSILGVMSGDIDTNPFIRVNLLDESMFLKTYVGHLTITWTETHTDSEGHIHTEVRTQVLTATSQHPAPRYSRQIYTYYGNNAAPDLHFSRQACSVDLNDEKKVRKFVDKEGKRLEKKAQKSLESGGHYQPMGNTEFEAIWGAENRDNEMQFRLLFTPLAQQNILELLRSKEGYGDDFYFAKSGKINGVSSIHSMSFYKYDPALFYEERSVELLRQHFVDNISELFRSLYFDLAPLLCIPLYQMTDAGPFKYDWERPADSMTDYEAMAAVNAMPESDFSPEGAATPSILKVTYTGHTGKADSFTVTAKAFRTEGRVDMIPVVGGDGHTHLVPVHWDEYIPIQAERPVTLRPVKDEPESNFGMILGRNGGYSRVGGFLGMLIDAYNDESEDRVSRALGEKTEEERN